MDKAIKSDDQAIVRAADAHRPCRCRCQAMGWTADQAMTIAQASISLMACSMARVLIN